MTERISIIVPVYNERATIASVVDRLQTVALPAPREIIVVNDGSSDGTRTVLDEIAVNQPSIRVIHVDVNRGKGHAVRMGFAQAAGSIVAIQDADLELDPAQLAELVQPILDGHTDVVYGSRFLGASATPGPVLTRAANTFLTWLTNRLYGARITDMETCYKIMRTAIARSLRLQADRFDIEPEITARLLLDGHRILERPVRFSPRSRAAGKKIGWRDGLVAIGVLVGMRVKRPPVTVPQGQAPR